MRLGEHNIAVNEGTEQWIDAAKLIKHPQYNSYNLDNDIMLIKLSRPATLNSYVQTVALPSRCPVADENCLVSGWGNTSANGSKLSVKAQRNRNTVLSVFSELFKENRNYKQLVTVSIYLNIW